MLLAAVGQVIGQERNDRRNGVKAAIEAERRSFDAKLAALEQRLKSVPGKLPVAKTWRQETVTYQAEIVSYDGALYQARKDTAQAPGGSDWLCVARAGRDGLTPTIRGSFDVHEKYAQFDIVTCDGFAFIAENENPGICPGSGWEVISRPRQARPPR